MTRLPLDFPPLVEMAERAAREWSDLWVRVRAERGDMGPWLGWDHADNADQRETETAVQAALLSDLTRPESQAVWLRWLAGRVGVPVSIGAPAWARHNTGWSCVVGYELGLDDGYGQALFWFGASPNHPERGDRLCPALPNPNSADAPIRALVLAVLTVGGAA